MDGNNQHILQQIFSCAFLQHCFDYRSLTHKILLNYVKPSTDISLYNVRLQTTVFSHNMPTVNYLASLYVL